MQNYIFDIETLGTESTAVILSIAILPFDFIEDVGTPFETLCKRTYFYKFAVEEQLKKGRTSNKDTLDWWQRQSPVAKSMSYTVSNNDTSPNCAINIMRQYIEPKKSIFWQRGSLDQVCFESLCRAYGQALVVPYYHWRDIRTALNCLGRDANYFKKIEGFVAHNPIHDCAKDVIALVTE